MYSSWPKIYKSKSTELEEERQIHTNVGNVNNAVSALDRKSKFSKDSWGLNNSIKKHDSIDT